MSRFAPHPAPAFNPPRPVPVARRAVGRHRLRDALAPWPVRFILFDLACSASLVAFGDTPLRTPLRVAVYAASLALLVTRLPRHRTHPALRLAVWVPVLLAIGLLNPERSTLLAGAAQAALYVSVLAPLSWVAAGRPDFSVLRRVALLMWGFYVASAALGVVQVYNPGRFQGAMAEGVANDRNFRNGSAAVVLADGTVSQKPMGLSDAPGGAAAGGVFAIILGTGILLAERSRWLRAMAVGGMAVGLFCIFLSQIRTSLIVVGICSLVTLGVLAWRADWGRVAKLGTVLGTVAVAGSLWAFAVAGDQTVNRFATLLADSPGKVYQKNRGQFLTQMLTEDIWKYPFGAGLGRWGMINQYFGNRATSIWSEMMWTSWLYDGGIPLVLLNAATLGAMLWTAWRIATRRGGMKEVAVWGAVILAFDVAAVAASLGNPIFSVQAGLEVWLLNALLFGASLDRTADRATGRRPLAGGEAGEAPARPFWRPSAAGRVQGPRR